MATVRAPNTIYVADGRPDVEFAPAFLPLFRKGFRYKVYYGGRGAAKSWSFARALTLKAIREKCRIGCFRELQNSIKDSVHQLIREQIDMMGLSRLFEVTDKQIRCLTTGSDFIFKGLRSNVTEIKSTEGVKYAWVEEAQLVSKDSWEILTPTIRAPDSEIWISFNPIDEEDPTYKKFVLQFPDGTLRVKVGYEDNPFMTLALERERRWLQKSDPDAYEHVWGGNVRRLSDSVIFKGKYVVETFERPFDPPPDRLFQGADFGFAQDPSTLIQMFMTGEAEQQELWIQYEAYGVGIELDDMPEFYDTAVPDCRKWPIKADSSRPETISHISRRGFNMSAAEKWEGCVEDGIAHIKAFRKIHIHERCKHVLQEARLYSYKRDRLTNEVLPVIIDKHNHCWDAIRYGLDGYIQQRGLAGVWGKL
jgi:phage terminase large subunit